jgi:integrase
MESKELMELCIKHDIKIKNIILKVIDGKDILKMGVDDWKAAFKNNGKMQRQSVDEYVKAYSLMYEACKSEGYTGYNPFSDSIELSSDNLFYYINEGIYIFPEELDRSVKINKIYWDCILGLLYEGAKEKNDIYDLKKEDVDLANREIHFKNYTINISKKLCESISLYYNIETYETIKSTGRNKTEVSLNYNLYDAYKDSFVKVPDHPRSEDNYTLFMHMISGTLVKTGFTTTRLYMSGLINYLYRKCNYSEEVLEDIFFKDNRSNSRELKKEPPQIELWALEYGLSPKVAKLSVVRYRYGAYVRDFLDRL